MTEGPYRDGRVHVLADRCSTCVFRPGNLMHLEAGRLKDLVEVNTANDSALICHQTLPYSNTGAEPAVCRGFFDKYPTLPLRMAIAMDVVAYDEPPKKEDA